MTITYIYWGFTFEGYTVRGRILKMGRTYFSNSAPDPDTNGDPVDYGVGEKGLNLLTNQSVTKVNGRWTLRVIRCAPEILLERFEEMFNMDTVPDNAH